MAASSESRFSLPEWLAIWTVVVVWGLNNVAGKISVEVLPPLFVGGLRFLLVLVCLAPFIRPPLPPWRSFLPVLLLVGPLHFGIVYWGFALADNLSLFAVSLQLWVPLTALFSWLILKEAAPPAALAGMGLAFAGVGFMTLDPRSAADVDGVLVGLVASVCWALGTVLVRRLPPIRALKLQGCVAVLAAPTLLLGSVVSEPDLMDRIRAATPLVWGCVAFAGLVSSLGASAALFWLVQRHSAARFTPYLLLSPLVTAVFGVAFLHDAVTPRLLAGAAATLAGVALVALAGRRRSRAPIATEPA